MMKLKLKREEERELLFTCCREGLRHLQYVYILPLFPEP
jgi:hypothetical protein